MQEINGDVSTKEIFRYAKPSQEEMQKTIEEPLGEQWKSLKSVGCSIAPRGRMSKFKDIHELNKQYFTHLLKMEYSDAESIRLSKSQIEKELTRLISDKISTEMDELKNNISLAKQNKRMGFFT